VTTAATFHDPDQEGPDIAQPVTVQRFPHGPFQAVKDLSPMLYLPPVVYATSPTQPQLRVFFSGYARHLHNYDIYEARFNLEDFLAGRNNRGKLEMGGENWNTELPPMNPTEVGNDPANPQAPGDGAGEVFEADALRSEFHSMHLDWMTPVGFINGQNDADPNLENYSPVTLAVRLRDVAPGFTDIQYYDLQWGTGASADAARGERYDETRGVYSVIPRLHRHKGDVMFADVPPVLVGAGTSGPVRDLEMVEPSTRGLADPLARRAVRMEIDPAIGQVRFSAPLFNPLNVADESCVFNTVTLAGTGFENVVDVFICGRYTPFLRRVTTSQADDDCPTVINQSGPWNGNHEAPTPPTPPAAASGRPWGLNNSNNNLVMFWRRTTGSGQAPYYGRTSYLMKQWSGTVRVNYPPIMDPDKNDVVVNHPDVGARPQQALVGPGMPGECAVDPTPTALPEAAGGGTRNEYDVDLTSGEIALWPGIYRWVRYPNSAEVHAGIGTVLVTYRGGDGQVHTDEPHAVGGGSQETVIPIDTVLSEGPLRVAEETYSVPRTSDTADTGRWPVARRYWIFWTSPRPLFDLRNVGAGGGNVLQSSDIYYCTVAPEFPTLQPQRYATDQARDTFWGW